MFTEPHLQPCPALSLDSLGLSQALLPALCHHPSLTVPFPYCPQTRPAVTTELSFPHSLRSGELREVVRVEKHRNSDGQKVRRMKGKMAWQTIICTSEGISPPRLNSVLV